MPEEIRVPALGESIREVQILAWLKKEGQWVAKDENVVQIESEKATVDLPAPVGGVVTKILKGDGQAAEVGEVIGYLDPAATSQAAMPQSATPRSDGPPAVPGSLAAAVVSEAREASASSRVMPAAQRVMAQAGLRPEDVQPTGPGGRILKEDAIRQSEMRRREGPSGPEGSASSPERPASTRLPTASAVPLRLEEAVPMSVIRRRIAQRLVEAQQTAALLTTFNEIDMSAVVDLRTRHREAFRKKYGVKLGFMSFFVKATVESLKQCPELNAEIRGAEILYRNYYDIGIAVGGGKGLVVPVLRDAQRMSFAEVELAIADFAARAQANRLTPEELTGGTFTITNGGVYGSLLSTPLVNPPQSGILGLHAIQDRPVAHDGQVVIRPMMYVAVTYDHRIVDGREAVGFLVRIKQILEEPSRMLLEI